MRITYFAADLSDPALAQRVRMLRAGGADIKLLGFRRSAAPIDSVEGVAAIDLGRTFPRRFRDRTLKVLGRSLGAWRWRDAVRDADVLLARNLEMWTVADAARVWAASRVPIVYECLDVHDLLLQAGLKSKLLRHWERRAVKRSAALMVSSPGFLTNHFERLGVDLPAVILAENKRVLPQSDPDRTRFTAVEAELPWRIGWFGILRCVKSFQILLALARRRPQLVDIQLRGRPTDELQNLISEHLPLPNMRFGGSYDQAELASIYRSCHLTWAIDYSQHGFNSDWLLPNRIYEGGYYNSPAIALAGTETANWLQARRAGVLLQDPEVELDAFMGGLTIARYLDLQRSSAAIPTRDLVHTIEECRRLTAKIAGVGNSPGCADVPTQAAL
jgi:succinoglycan biosynthesis protein ExoL